MKRRDDGEPLTPPVGRIRPGGWHHDCAVQPSLILTAVRIVASEARPAMAASLRPGASSHHFQSSPLAENDDIAIRITDHINARLPSGGRVRFPDARESSQVHPLSHRLPEASSLSTLTGSLSAQGLCVTVCQNSTKIAAGQICTALQSGRGRQCACKCGEKEDDWRDHHPGDLHMHLHESCSLIAGAPRSPQP